MIKAREHLRVPLPIPVRIKLIDVDEEFRLATLRDISWGGTFVLMVSPPAVGTRVVVQFLLSDASVTVELWGTVVRRKTDGSQEEPSGIGVRFDPLDEDLRGLIQRLVEEEIRGLLQSVK